MNGRVCGVYIGHIGLAQLL